MKLNEINIRDPYILPYKGTYYLYGTRSATCWGKAEGFDCYFSKDLEEWEGPVEIFHRSGDFPLDENYWAPECYVIDGRFYLLTTFGGRQVKKGIYLLVSDSPTGPFTLYSGRLTPENWTCIDGTLYQKDGHTYVLFSHSFEDGVLNGDMCCMELSADLKEGISQPLLLFSAAEAPWPKPFPWAKEEFGIEGDCYFTDGPFLLEGEDGSLHLYWSSWCTNGYGVGEAVSESGKITGPWKHLDRLIFPENGGHGMAFYKADKTLLYTLHYPNDKYKEHPIFIEIEKGK